MRLDTHARASMRRMFGAGQVTPDMVAQAEAIHARLRETWPEQAELLDKMRAGPNAETMWCLFAIGSELREHMPDRPREGATDAEFERRQTIRARGLPRSLEQAIIEGCDKHGRKLYDSDAYLMLRFALQQKAAIIVLEGDTGSGKSMAAARAICELGRGVWTTAGEFCDLRWGDSRRERLRECLLLIVDELGREHRPEDISRLIIDRDNAGGTTVLLTEMSAIDFERAGYGDAVIERINRDRHWHHIEHIERPGQDGFEERSKGQTSMDV